MSDIQFSKEERAHLVERLQRYFEHELNQSIGGFDAGFLLDYLGREVGAYYYNRGLYDAQTQLAAKLEELGDAILQLEKPTEFQR